MGVARAGEESGCHQMLREAALVWRGLTEAPLALGHKCYVVLTMLFSLVFLVLVLISRSYCGY